MYTMERIGPQMETNRARSRYLQTVGSRFLDLGSFRIHYLESGAGPKTIILVHGGGMWLYSFRHNIPSLSRRSRVIALDMPGYGYTLPRDGVRHRGLETTSEVLLEFMDRLDLERASFLGHSWGGGWVLHFAHLHPGRVEKIVLIDSSGLNVRDILEWELLKYPVIGGLLLRSVTMRAVRKRLMRSFFHQERVTEDMALEVYRPLTFRHNRRLQLQLARSQDWSVTEQALPGLEHPALIIWGENDRYLDAGLLRRFESLLKNSRSFVFRTCGHSAHEEYPTETNTLVAAFLDRNGP